MTFGHLNVASLYSHYADVDVVLKKSNIDGSDNLTVG